MGKASRDAVRTHKGFGLVLDVFNDRSIFDHLIGDAAVGHTRYSTSGNMRASMPLVVSEARHLHHRTSFNTAVLLLLLVTALKDDMLACVVVKSTCVHFRFGQVRIQHPALRGALQAGQFGSGSQRQSDQLQEDSS